MIAISVQNLTVKIQEAPGKVNTGDLSCMIEMAGDFTLQTYIFMKYLVTLVDVQ